MRATIRLLSAYATLALLLLYPGVVVRHAPSPLLVNSQRQEASLLADASDPAVRNLAKVRHIPIQEAQRRIGWQTRVGSFGLDLRAALGSRFGGVWIDPADGDRVKVGIVGGRAEVRRQLERWSLGDAADAVRVRYGLGQLETINRRLTATLARANGKTRWPVYNGIPVDRNAVQLSLPPKRHLSAAQWAAVAELRRRYGSLLVFRTYKRPFYDQACTEPSTGSGLRCDPPLRGGVVIKHGTRQCTAGFVTKSKVDSVKYIFTAGHCMSDGHATGDWSSLYNNAEGHAIGPNWGTPIDSANGDVAIIRINNASASGWNPKHWVYLDSSPNVPDYYIINDAPSSVGDTVCLTGAFGESQFGTSCGTVAELDFGGSKFTRTNVICAVQGDSGGPYFSGHVAYGIHKAGSVEGCGETLYQEVQDAESLKNVNVIHGG